MFRYWLPVVAWMLSQVGAFGLRGGFAGSRPAWQLAHDTPIRTCGPAGVETTRLRTPMTPADAGSAHLSKPNVDASPSVQSGSLMSPNVSNRTARGVRNATSRPSARLNGGFGRMMLKNFSPP